MMFTKKSAIPSQAGWKWYSCFLLLALLFACEYDKEEAVARKNNILFILADDLGYHDLGCMGSKYYETPNIDQIAKQGTLFTQGYATCQVCSPSRASLLSGKFPARHGITDWIGARTGEDWRKNNRYTPMLPPAYKHNLPHDYITLPEVLKENGYATFFAGKWHLGSEGSYPEDHGFDVNQGGYERGGPYTGGYFSPFNNPKMEDKVEEQGMSLSMKLAKETSAFIKDNRDHPFLAYLAFYAVHAPIQTTETKWSKYRAKSERQGIADIGFEMERILPIRLYQDNPVYAGLVEEMDDAVGYLLKTLKELHLDDETIVIFTSDNGGVASGDDFATSNAPLRGGKGYQWEGGLRVPLLVYVPWLDGHRQSNDIPVTGADLYPTILELLDIPLRPDEHIDGTSLLPLLEGNLIKARPLYWHYPHYGNQGGEPSSVIRLGDWKLIHYFEDDRDELYHIPSDPTEQHDVAQAHQEIATELSQQLHQYLTDVDAKYPFEDTRFKADSLQQKIFYYQNDLRISLEKQRIEILDTNWQPNEDWWGSKIEE
ncbi:MAG: sulfatase [Saprospiraceae bacterium]|nr:sulfatase [Saprospiraceae bacterium]